MINVAIIDDQNLLVQGLESLLSPSESIQVVQTFTQPIAALEGLQLETVDVVLLDIHMPEMSGIELCEKLLQKCPTLKIIALTTYDEGEMVKKMLEKGASGYLLKSTDTDALSQAIQKVHEGGKALSNELKDKMIESLYASPKPKEQVVLTRREKDVLREIAAGLKIHEIAEKLFISENTVVSHRKNLFSKFGVHNAASLVLKARDAGVV